MNSKSEATHCSGLLEVYLYHNKVEEFKSVISLMQKYELFVFNKHLEYYKNSNNLTDELKRLLELVTKEDKKKL